jgi:hypothetical protein
LVTYRIWGALALILFTAATAHAQPFTAQRLASRYHLQSHREHSITELLQWDIPGDSHAKYFFQLVRVADKLGYQVVLVDFRKAGFFSPEALDSDVLDNLWGYNFGPIGGKKTIALAHRLAPNGLVNTLAHELAHELQPPVLLAMPQSQVFAQAVAEVYCQTIKLDSMQAGFNYMARFEDPAAVMDKWHKEIDAAVQVLLGK